MDLISKECETCFDDFCMGCLIFHEHQRKGIRENMKVKTKLNFLFDFHGVLEKYPMLFRPIMKSLRNSGHRITIASGSPIEKLMGELEEKGYLINHHYDIVVSVYQFLKNNGAKFTYDENGNPWCDDDIWWKSKGKICEKHDIDIMIDDTIKYKEFIPEKTMFMLL